MAVIGGAAPSRRKISPPHPANIPLHPRRREGQMPSGLPPSRFGGVFFAEGSAACPRKTRRCGTIAARLPAGQNPGFCGKASMKSMPNWAIPAKSKGNGAPFQNAPLPKPSPTAQRRWGLTSIPQTAHPFKATGEGRDGENGPDTFGGAVREPGFPPLPPPFPRLPGGGEGIFHRNRGNPGKGREIRGGEKMASWQRADQRGNPRPCSPWIGAAAKRGGKEPTRGICSPSGRVSETNRGVKA